MQSLEELQRLFDTGTASLDSHIGIESVASKVSIVREKENLYCFMVQTYPNWTYKPLYKGTLAQVYHYIKGTHYNGGLFKIPE